MLTTETEIVNKLGLHARASAKLTQLAGKYACEVWMASISGESAQAARRPASVLQPAPPTPARSTWYRSPAMAQAPSLRVKILRRRSFRLGAAPPRSRVMIP